MKTKIYLMTVAVGVLAGSVAFAQNETKQSTEQNQPKNAPKNAQSSTAQSGVDAQQKGQSVKIDDLPKAVQQAFKKHTGDFNIENVTKQTQDGKTVYHGSFDHGNMRTQLRVAEDGSILGLEQTRDFALGAVLPEPNTAKAKQKLEELPQPVQDTIKRVNGPKLSGISKETINDKTVYRVGFNEGPVHSDVFIAENGDIVAQRQVEALALVPLMNTQRVTFKSAPEAVQKTIQEQAGEQEVTDLDKGQWNGQTAFRAKVTKDGQEQQLIVSEDGKVLNQSGAQIQEAAGAQRENLQLQDLPQAAREKVRAKIGNGKIQSIEKTMKDGHAVYNVQCEMDGQQKTIQVSEDGKILNQ